MNKVIILFCFSFLLILAGCENNVGGHAFFDQINEIENSLENPDWDRVTAQAEELKKLYKKDKWKLQLLGDEDEYESLYESINKLIVAIEEKDRTNIKLELSVIHTHIEDIYSL
ncbi:DUF4363 family protein [Ornithinibacillus sp. BX22]|uniref:DUF4363 family protein n=1 Tax=Ornithinibacillus hominis TaxID=2763055 RepID=A0A923L987_9BACI|nr:DUF4363 family protein [Ornithinibacillus hominis]MBC5638687.1 DUF4363 family protein [Ornithinibacillus hominis]